MQGVGREDNPLGSPTTEEACRDYAIVLNSRRRPPPGPRRHQSRRSVIELKHLVGNKAGRNGIHRPALVPSAPLPVSLHPAPMSPFRVPNSVSVPTEAVTSVFMPSSLCAETTARIGSPSVREIQAKKSLTDGPTVSPTRTQKSTITMNLLLEDDRRPAIHRSTRCMRDPLIRRNCRRSASRGFSGKPIQHTTIRHAAENEPRCIPAARNPQNNSGWRSSKRKP